MTKSEFLHEASHLIFKEIAKSVNMLCGLSKTSSMIANIFTTLPIQIELRHITGQPKPSKKLNAIDEFVHAYIKHDDSTKVYIAFYYDTEKQLNRISKAINKHPEFFAYLYMREALKLTRLMNTKTHYTMMSGIIKYNNPGILPEDYYRYSIAACNMAVSNTIKQLFNASAISDKLSKIMEHKFPNPNSSLSEMDILKSLVHDSDLVGTPMEPIDDHSMYDPYLNEVFTKGNIDGSIPIDEHIQTNLGESLTTHFASMSRGTSSAAIFEAAFTAKKVKTGWFKKLAAKFSRDVFYMTNNFRSQWSGLNVTYRHKFKAPKAHYEDNKLVVVTSIDHSGSVSTVGLQKLLYLYEKHSKKITKIIVLIHDTEVVKEFILEDDFDISSNPNFKQALAHRFAVGGTSHSAVMANISAKLADGTIDPDKTIYISFSDNYSDIPESWAAHPAMSKLSTTFLTPQDNPMNIPGTADIAMQ